MGSLYDQHFNAVEKSLQCFAKLLKLGDPLEDFFRLAKASFQFGLDILVPVKNFMKSMHESTEHRIFRRVTELIA